MAQKISMAKRILSPDIIVIARTHSLIVNESLSELQNRIDSYTKAGADVLCVHYTGGKWDYYKRVIDKFKISRPLMVIFSKSNFLPKVLDYSKIRYVLFPNQFYRMMMRPILDFKNNQKGLDKSSIEFKPQKLIDTREIFNIISKIRQ